MKSLNKYLAIKKQVKAPNDEAKEAKKIPGIKPNRAPINKHKIAATGNANTDIKK